MAIKIIAKKSGFGVKDGISVRPNEMFISGMPNIAGYGFIDVVIRIDGESFKELAQAMIDANACEALKAFGAAMQSGIDRAQHSDKTEKVDHTDPTPPRSTRRSLATPHV